MRHPFSAPRSILSWLLSSSIFADGWRFALWIALLAALIATPVAAQDGTPSPRAGDLPGTAAGCNELLLNGGFEVPNFGWEPLTPGLPPELDHAYVASPVFAGTQALRIGIVEGANTAITGGVYQVVNLPAQASPIVLSFRYQPRHEANPGSDLQFLDVIDESSGERTRLWAELANQNSWLFSQINLTHLQGRRVRVEFGVSNNGDGGGTALYLDQVSLQSCPSTPGPTPTGITLTPSPTAITSTPTPTPIIVEINTPTPTLASPFPTATPTSIVALPTVTPSPIVVTPILSPTPLPPGCISNIIVNGSFEEAVDGGYGWIIGDDPVPPRLSSDAAQDGLRSMRMGNPPGPGSSHVKSYSSVRQLITIPPTALTARLNWAHQSFTQAAPNPFARSGDDRQELILLSPDLATLEIMYRQLRNDSVWRAESVDLTNYIGQSFFIYFNVFNNTDSLRTWMFLDSVRLDLCFTAPPTPTNAPFMGTETPIPVVTAEAVERTVPLDGDRSLVVTPTGDAPLEVIEPANDEGTATLLAALGSLIARNWLWFVGVAVLAWLVWRFVLR